ncbi:RNA polymerase sigma factor [Actinomadura madurae]|uniref:RNA polymerase sigma factor n=1 Tax=Actinomadura madurae TaxID=1993 RepID=UPI0020D2333A|nr:RNA polymerase sigma factor [Actinomadura madurae]MCP9976796.1 RNA polymerase sigma factor [Actinomadura madurae]MCQ0011722.1 RNA polymerase sigma factor [Actinomadura madurae]
MPRSAVETPLTESAGPALNDLLKRGRAQGHLSLDEVRGAFESAGLSPAQGRSILRELSEAGISLAGESDTARRRAAAADHATGETAQKTPGTARTAGKRAPRKPAAKTASPKDAGTGESAARAPRAAAQADAPADGGFEVTEVEADESQADLDDQTTGMGDSVHTYLKAIGRRQLLTAEQEVDLAKRIEAGLYAEHKLETEDLSPALRADLEWVAADGRRAKAHMLEANLRLVVSVAKKYSDRGLSLLDVVQEGNLGLIRAVEKFDYSKGYKFSTYAMWWIRQAIQRGFADSARTIRLPVHVLEMLSKLSRVERDMHQRLGREPTPEELAAELDKSPEQVRELLRTSRQPISLDSTIGEDGETRIGDLIEDTDSPEASELVDRQLMADQLRRTLDILSPREAKIMAMRFGLYDGTPRTLDEIGKALGLTRERIRQLEKESLSKLRHPSNARPLLDFAV